MKYIFYPGKLKAQATGGSFTYCSLVEEVLREKIDNLAVIIDERQDGTILQKLSSRIIRPFRVLMQESIFESTIVISAHFWQGLVCSFLPRRRVSKRYHFFFAPYYKERQISLAKRKIISSYILKQAERWYLRYCDIVCVLSSHSMRELTHIYDVPEEKIRIIPPYVSDILEQIEVNERIKIRMVSKVLVVVRRIEKRMGIDILIRAIELKKEILRHNDIKILVLGKGSRLDEYRKLIETLNISDRIELRGYVSDPERDTIYDNSYAAIVPTVDLEGFGISTLEALSYGLPVIGTKVGATPEILQPINQSLIIEPGDIVELSNAIEKITSISHEEYVNLCRKCFEESKKFNRERFVAELSELLN